jgi:hypothetical protein
MRKGDHPGGGREGRLRATEQHGRLARQASFPGRCETLSDKRAGIGAQWAILSWAAHAQRAELE